MRLSRENDAIRTAAVAAGELSKDDPLWALNRRIPAHTATFAGIICVLERALELACRQLENEWGANRPLLPRLRLPVIPVRDPRDDTVDDGSYSGECGLQRRYIEQVLQSFNTHLGCVVTGVRTGGGFEAPVLPAPHVTVYGVANPVDEIADVDADQEADRDVLDMASASVAAVHMLMSLSKPVQASQPAAGAVALDIGELSQISDAQFVKAGYSLAIFAGCAQRLLNYSCCYDILDAAQACTTNEDALNTILDFPVSVDAESRLAKQAVSWQSKRRPVSVVVCGGSKRRPEFPSTVMTPPRESKRQQLPLREAPAGNSARLDGKHPPSHNFLVNTGAGGCSRGVMYPSPLTSPGVFSFNKPECSLPLEGDLIVLRHCFPLIVTWLDLLQATRMIVSLPLSLQK